MAEEKEKKSGKKGSIHIIGSSHIARQSVKEVQEFVEKEKPDIIAVELDANRMMALLEEKKKRRVSARGVFRIGFAGFMFSLIGMWVQKRLGDLVGMNPGSEMKAAIELSRKHKLQLALIDQDVNVTLKQFSKNFGWKEIKQMLKDMFSRRKKELPFDIKDVPSEEVIEQLLLEVKERYPRIYKVLISDRNRVMVSNLKHLQQLHPEKNILAVVGAGHKREMERMLSEEYEKRKKTALLSRIHPSSLSAA